MAKNTPPTDSTEPDEPTTPVSTGPTVSSTAERAPEPTAAPVTATPRRRLGALPIAGIVTGSVLAAGLLFGGGVALGAALPDEGPGAAGIRSGAPLESQREGEQRGEPREGEQRGEPRQGRQQQGTPGAGAQHPGERERHHGEKPTDDEPTDDEPTDD